MPPSSDVNDWLEWVLVTSVPLLQIDKEGRVIDQATGTLVDFCEHRFVLSVEHAVKRGTTGWAIEIGYDPELGTDVYYPRGFAYVGESTRNTGTMLELDLCFAEISASLEPRYEHRTPRGLFDQRPRHIFKAENFATPNQGGVFAFSGRVKKEQHGADALVSEMTVYPGLKYLRSENELHIFELPVPHPGHDAFHGCSGAPIVDFNGKVVALVKSGNRSTSTISGVAIQRCIPGLQFFCDRSP